MKKIVALIWALVAGRRDRDNDQVDLVPADCEDCGYPLEYCVCGLGYDVSDYYDYVEAAR